MEGYQRKYLRGLAHSLAPVVEVGKEGCSEAVIAAVDDALTHGELIKIRLHKPDDKKEMARTLAHDCSAELCGLVGHTVILYRRNPEEPKIVLPTRNH